MKVLRRNDHGFTMIEVLVVMIIIGIVAAIAVPIYLNQKKTADQLSVTTDLNNAMILVAQQKQYGSYPTTLSSEVKVSPGVQLTLKTSADGSSTCIQGYHNSTPTKIYHITPETKKTINGVCP